MNDRMQAQWELSSDPIVISVKLCLFCGYLVLPLHHTLFHPPAVSCLIRRWLSRAGLSLASVPSTLHGAHIN